VRIPLQLGEVLVRGGYPSPLHMLAAIGHVFIDKMVAGAVYHVTFVGRLVIMLSSLMLRIVNIIMDPSEPRGRQDGGGG
jgi:hypothetical protein